MITFRSYLNEINAQYNILKHNDLTRRPQRMEIFISKLQNNEEFLTTKGMVKIKIKQDELNNVIEKIKEKGFTYTFNSNKGKINYPKDFYKSAEFGGRGKGSGVAKENYYLSKFEKLLEETKEKIQKPYVPIQVPGEKTIYRITSVQSTPGTPKSDFHLIDINGNEVMWLSHKDGTTVKAYQQYGGILEVYKTTKSKELEEFIKILQNITAGEFPKGKAFMRVIKNKKDKLVAIFGKDYGKKRGRNNVDVLLQGNIQLLNKGNYFILDSSHTIVNGEVPAGEYEPVYFARYSSDRNNLGITACRAMIAPLGIVSGRDYEEI